MTIFIFFVVPSFFIFDILKNAPPTLKLTPDNFAT